MSSLPPGAIIDDEEPQQWHDEPEQQQAEAKAGEEAEDGDADDDEGEDAEDEDDDDEQIGEDGETTEPWLGASGGAADYAARYAAALAEAGVGEAAGQDGAAAEEEYAEADIAEEHEEEAEAEAEQPQAGDLTAAFFAEMSASQSSHKKRGRADAGSDDDECGMVQSRAFAIPQHLLRSFDPTSTAPPASAEEYLLRVRMEAAACPRVKVSNIDPRAYAHRQTAYVPNLGAVARPSNEACLPSEQWQNEFANEFAQARQQLLCFAANHSSLRKHVPANTPTKRNFPAWVEYCVGDVQRQLAQASAPASALSAAAAATSTPAAPAPSGSLAHAPSLPLVVAMDQVQTKGILMELMQLAVDTIAKRQGQAERAAKAATAGNAQDALPPFPFPSHAYTLWLYTLLLKVDKPLTSPVSAGMRAAYRSLCWLRAHLNDPAAEEVKYCNMLLTLLDRSFGQGVQWNEQMQQERAQQRQQYMHTATPQHQWQQEQKLKRQKVGGQENSATPSPATQA